MITIDSLRNAYFGLAARYARGGNMRYVRFGQGGFEMPSDVTSQEEARAAADRYIQEHPELSEDDIAVINQMVTSFAGQGSRDTTATGAGVPPRDSIVTGTGVPPADSIATGAGVNPGETVVGTVGGGNAWSEPAGQLGGPGHFTPNTQDIHAIADGRAGRVIGNGGGNAGGAPSEGGGASANPWDNLPDLGEVEIENPWIPGDTSRLHIATTPRELYDEYLNNPDINYNAPEYRNELKYVKNRFLNKSPFGKAWKADMAARAAEGNAYGREALTRARVQYDIDRENADKAYWDAQRAKAREAVDKDVAAIDWDEYMRPVEEENIGNEGVTDYNDFYNNASRKDIRGVAHGKGWTNANGEELLWTGDNRRQNRQYARSVRQGRRQDIRNIRNGQPRSEEYRYAPRFERNGGAMMRMFIGAMRRGGRL